MRCCSFEFLDPSSEAHLQFAQLIEMYEEKLQSSPLEQQPAVAEPLGGTAVDLSRLIARAVAKASPALGCRVADLLVHLGGEV